MAPCSVTALLGIAMVAAANVIFASGCQLPAVVASHLDGGVRADATMSRDAHLLLMIVMSAKSLGWCRSTWRMRVSASSSRPDSKSTRPRSKCTRFGKDSPNVTARSTASLRRAAAFTRSPSRVAVAASSNRDLTVWAVARHRAGGTRAACRSRWLKHDRKLDHRSDLGPPTVSYLEARRTSGTGRLRVYPSDRCPTRQFGRRPSGDEIESAMAGRRPRPVDRPLKLITLKRPYAWAFPGPLSPMTGSSRVLRREGPEAQAESQGRACQSASTAAPRVARLPQLRYESLRYESEICLARRLRFQVDGLPLWVGGRTLDP